jgi:hypothetical protein
MTLFLLVLETIIEGQKIRISSFRILVHFSFLATVSVLLYCVQYFSTASSVL